MKLFYTNSSAKEEIGKLETQVSTLEADNAAATADITRLTEELKTANESLSAMTAERDEAANALEVSEKALTKANADLATAQEAVADFPGKVESAAQAKFESLGGPPLETSEKNEQVNGKADNSALTGHAKVSAFFKSKEK